MKSSPLDTRNKTQTDRLRSKFVIVHHTRCDRTGVISAGERQARAPAAMMAGVVDTLWKFEDLYDRVTG
jgi:hypothetical protein